MEAALGRLKNAVLCFGGGFQHQPYLLIGCVLMCHASSKILAEVGIQNAVVAFILFVISSFSIALQAVVLISSIVCFLLVVFFPTINLISPGCLEGMAKFIEWCMFFVVWVNGIIYFSLFARNLGHISRHFIPILEEYMGFPFNNNTLPANSLNCTLVLACTNTSSTN